MSGRLRGQMLAELREDLARIGYARTEDSNEYEDHFSALCDVMRGLIGESAMSEDAAGQQQVFFQHYLASWHGRLFEKVDQAAGADFYRKVARVADAFLTHETQYFELA
jgi:TorA maturation chaperone TorD